MYVNIYKKETMDTHKNSKQLGTHPRHCLAEHFLTFKWTTNKLQYQKVIYVNCYCPRRPLLPQNIENTLTLPRKNYK